MHRAVFIVAAVLWAALGTASASQLPGTLNFADVTKARVVTTVIELASNEKEIETGDFDNDGDLDVVIANAHSDFGQRRNKLYRNDDGVFTEISATGVINFVVTDVSRNAFFRDYDLDGWLDIIIVNDANTTGEGGRTKLFMNQHPDGVFDSFSEEGVERLGGGTGGAACGAVSIDVDMDGDWDLYVGNYPFPSQDTMYFNDAAQNPKNPGFFSDVTVTNVPQDSDYTVDISSADLNGDGKLDLLVANGFNNPCRIYYNDNEGAGGGVGVYNYKDSTTVLGVAAFETSMEPGDFNNDGNVDIYWANESQNADVIMENLGQDKFNKATFDKLSNLPDAVTTATTRKVTVADLNNDGRVDVFVMRQFANQSRPVVLRNTSVNGTISFIDWSPAPAFPAGPMHQGWHAAAFDTNGDGDLDIFLGGFSGDHLFENVPGAEYQKEDLVDGVIPDVFNGDPAAVTAPAIMGGVDTYTINGLDADGFLSVVLSGPDDYRLEILSADNSVLRTIDRGGVGIEEASQYEFGVGPGTLKLRVTVLACGPHDLTNDCQVAGNDVTVMFAAWGSNPGHPADFDGDDFVGILDLFALFEAWGGEYQLEVLSRDNLFPLPPQAANGPPPGPFSLEVSRDPVEAAGGSIRVPPPSSATRDNPAPDRTADAVVAVKSASSGTAAALTGVTTVHGTSVRATSCSEIAQIIVNASTNPRADFDGDGQVTIWDLFAAFAECE